MNDQRIQPLVQLLIKRRDLVLINAIRQTYSEMDRQQTRPVVHRLLNKRRMSPGSESNASVICTEYYSFRLC